MHGFQDGRRPLAGRARPQDFRQDRASHRVDPRPRRRPRLRRGLRRHHRADGEGALAVRRVPLRGRPGVELPRRRPRGGHRGQAHEGDHGPRRGSQLVHLQQALQGAPDAGLHRLRPGHARARRHVETIIRFRLLRLRVHVRARGVHGRREHRERRGPGRPRRLRVHHLPSRAPPRRGEPSALPQGGGAEHPAGPRA